MFINEIEIGPGCPPYIIAEMSANHGGSIEEAKRLIDSAVECGASAVKMQTYRPDTITLNSDAEDFLIKGTLWSGRTLYDLYAEAHTPWEWHEPLFRHARNRGITIFSSPFDSTAVDLLEELEAPAYKVASFELVDIPLIKRIAATGKPMIMSTGMADAEEIEEAVLAAGESGCKDLILLHCVSGYPAPPADYNLRTLVDMQKRFGCMVGLSDHTMTNATAVAAVALGAVLIEKHFTLDRGRGGPDDSFSLDPAGLRDLCQSARIAWDSLGVVDYGRKSSEVGNVQFRRSLYWVRNLAPGHIVTDEDFRSVRPGYGLPPKRFESLVGRRLARAVSASTATMEADFE